MDFQKILLSFLIVFNLLCLHYSIYTYTRTYGLDSLTQNFFGAAQNIQNAAQNVQNASPTTFTKGDINAGCQLRIDEFTTDQKETLCSTYLESQKEFYEKEFTAEKEKLENEGWFSSFKLSNADNNDATVDDEDS